MDFTKRRVNIFKTYNSSQLDQRSRELKSLYVDALMEISKERSSGKAMHIAREALGLEECD